jgi:Tfp pilus assembly protein PilV
MFHAPRIPLFPQAGKSGTIALRGMTLVELCIAATLLAIGMVAVLGGLLFSRSLSEGSIYQNAAVTVVQGYIEQMKNMEFSDLPYTDATGAVKAGAGLTADQIPTMLNAETADSLVISTSTTIPALDTITTNADPSVAGLTDNIKTIDINSTPTNSNDDLRLNLRVWVQDISNAGANATQVRALTIQYAWQNGTGANRRIFRGTVRTIRSAVPTF